jgi:glyoxylase-like metal-dependent hydrolase (beta-lactamase superfamily II)
MKKVMACVVLVFLFQTASFTQTAPPQIGGKEVARNDDVVFHQIDEHTWVGTGHAMYNESLYLVEGANKSVLIDAGTKIADLDKIVASITKKPVMLVATHAHPDHTGSAINCFSELYINPGDKAASFLANYKGTLKDLKDGEKIDLGGRELEVAFTPGHTPGSTTFVDAKAGYGFSGDSFGSGNLLLSGTFSTLIDTCRKTSVLMEKYGIRFLYPGHYFGNNAETKQRVIDEMTIGKDVLSGKVKSDANPTGMMGLNLIVNLYGVRINYSEKSIR